MNRIAGCVVADQYGRFLLVKEKQEEAYDRWNIPEGSVATYENPKATAVRETKQKTGYDVIADDDPLISEENKVNDCYYQAFMGRIASGELTPKTEEIQDAAWMDFEKIDYLNATHQIREPWMFAAIKAAHENYRH